MVSSGEWSSGKRWADDAPKEAVDADTVSVIESGACGAFVHGLEDEFLGGKAESAGSGTVGQQANHIYIQLDSQTFDFLSSFQRFGWLLLTP